MKKIDIKGAVVDDDTAAFYNFFGIANVSPSVVSAVLNDGDIGEDVEVNIASNGGDVFAASEIFTMLKSSSANVTVNIQGLAASAASVIAMAGDTIKISPTAQIMIHQASVMAGGNKDDLTHEAAVLDNIDQSIASAYEQKTGMSQDDLLNMMAQETWLTATEAVDKGFADEIMFVADNEPAFANDLSGVVPKSAVNKLMNLISKTQPVNGMSMKPKKSSSADDDNADDNLLPALNPLYPEGTKITVLADHMDGMKGATGVVTHAYLANTYIIDYQPTDGSSEIKGHRWVTEDEIENQKSSKNTTVNIVPKSAVNKPLNLLNKSEKTKKLENTTNESQPTDALKQSKVAILLGKTKETN